MSAFSPHGPCPGCGVDVDPEQHDCPSWSWTPEGAPKDEAPLEFSRVDVPTVPADDGVGRVREHKVFEAKAARLARVKVLPGGGTEVTPVPFSFKEVRWTAEGDGRWLDDDAGRPVTVLGAAGGVTLDVTVKEVSVPVLALVTGLHVVDLSLEWEPHLVRGTE